MTAKWKVSPDMKSTKLQAQEWLKPRAYVLSLWVAPFAQKNVMT